jgi:hypothetical protein
VFGKRQMAEVISRIPTQVPVKSQNTRTTEEVTIIPSRIPRFGEKLPQRQSRDEKSENVSSSSLEKHLDEPVNVSSNPTTPKHSNEEKRTPRYEAFLMTGDKMLNLNPKVSPSYAKICQEQLPPATEVGDSTPQRRGTFDEFPPLHTQGQRRFDAETAVPATQSESILDKQEDENSCMDSEACISNLQNHVESNNMSSSTLPDNASNSVIYHSTRSDFNKTHSFITPQFLEGRLSDYPKMATRQQQNSISTRSPEHASVTENDVETNSYYAKSVDNEAVVNTARQMFDLINFRRATVAEFLMQSNAFGEALSNEYFQLFNFSGVRIDAALRDFLTHVCLTGESSDRARLLYSFSGRYFECNPTLFKSPDEIHALTCALILLNTDLHGPNIGKKMTVREFVDNLGHTQYSYERNLLKVLYNAVKSTPFKYLDDDQEKTDVQDGQATRASGVFRRLSRKISKKGAEIKDQIDYKHGWVVKKSVYDIDGKKTPFGRRKWQMLYATLRGMVLYLHKSEHGFEAGKFNTYNNCILLHHAIATIPNDYKKRQNVFRLRTANFGEMLFQTGDPLEVFKWVDAINFVSAAFSTPALPLPAGSDTVVFNRPLLPSKPSTFSMQSQLRSHQCKVVEMEDRLTILRSNAPSIKAKGKKVYDYFFRERYLDSERERYETYVKVLREKLASVSQTDLCSRGSSVRMTTPTKNAAYITSIPITNNSSTVYHNTPVTTQSTMSSARGNSLRHDGKLSTPSESSSNNQAPALAEAMRIASGCLPNVPAAGEIPMYSDEDRMSYKEAMQQKKH